MNAETDLKRTPLYDLHVALGGKMVPFASYEMPVQYPAGIIKEHQHTRAAAGLFDIAHMGLITVKGGADIRERLEKIFPADITGLTPGAIRYSFLLNDQCGVLDDLMITRLPEGEDQNTMIIVVNAGCKDQDLALLQKLLPDMRVTLHNELALLALQGPKAAEAFSHFSDAPQKLKFMQGGYFDVKGAGRCYISRSGYTGEDGFEMAIPNTAVKPFVEGLLKIDGVMPIGLGARDSLRLEAGLCLYGHELDTTITPVEADVMWAVAKRRRAEGGFIGAATMQKQLAEGVKRKRVAIKPEGRALAREQTDITDADGRKIGIVTSGGFGPSVDGPIAMGYVETAFATPDTPITLVVRGKPLPAKIVKLPFVPHRYYRG